MANPKNIIIAPHADDEVLGCGGFLSYYPKKSYVILMSRHERERMDEFYSVSKSLQFLHESLGLSDRFFSKNFVSETADRLETIISDIVPEKVFIPYPSIHQDHRYTYEVSLIALRKFVGNIYLYEYPEGVSHFGRFTPNTYLPLSEDLLHQKITALHLYKSQIKEGRDAPATKGLAAIRGLECHCNFAEAYQLIKGRL